MSNEAYFLDGTTYKFQNHDSPNAAWTVEGLANAAGRVSAQLDLGSGARPAMLQWLIECQFQATPTQGKGLEIYASFALTDLNTRMLGDIGTSDAALGDVDMRRNLIPLGYVVSENAAASEKCIGGGWFFWPYRYIQLIAYNDSGASVNATAANFIGRLLSGSMQGQ